MFRRIRRRITYTNVILTLGLFFMMSGGAYAAKRYLITSTSQISPKVLQALQGKPGVSGPAGAKGETGSRGPTGPTGPPGSVEQGARSEPGPAGPTGPQGKEGKEGEEGLEGAPGKDGSPWTAGGTLPVGASEKGVWALDGPPSPHFLGLVQAPISFGIPLKEAPVAQVIAAGGTPEPGCKGTASNPEADPGNLCIFIANQINIAGFVPLEIFAVGAILVAEPEAEKPTVYANGTWVATGK